MSLFSGKFFPPTDLEPGDIVWIKWESLYHSGLEPRACAAMLIKIYDDGNIICRRGDSPPILVFAEDIYAKSPGIYSIHLSTVVVSRHYIENKLKELK